MSFDETTRLPDVLVAETIVEKSAADEVDELIAMGVIGAWGDDPDEDSVYTVRKIRESMWQQER